MPVLQGFKTIWNRHPEWHERYDFAVTEPPVYSTTYDTKTLTYLDPTLWGLLGTHAPFFFSCFHWIDDDGEQHTVRAVV